jgi:hypothetical protein
MTIEAMKQALEALEEAHPKPYNESLISHVEAITALRTAIAEADEQEAWKTSDTAYRPEGLPQDFIKHEVDSFADWSEWVCPDPTQYFMKCCNCGLVHEMQFNVVKYSAGDECEDFDDPYVQAVFRARRANPPAAPVQDSTCNKTLRAEGKGYPRTCRKCGKGPCIADRVQPEHEPVAQIIALGQYEFPGLEWLSADHSFRAPIGTLLYTTPTAAPVQEPEHKGCACRWDGEGGRTVTCERHEGWLEVIAEWADRAREAEAKLKAAAQRQPLTDEQIDAGVAAWFATETVVGGRPFEKRMRAAIEAAHGITGEKPNAS